MKHGFAMSLRTMWKTYQVKLVLSPEFLYSHQSFGVTTFPFLRHLVLQIIVARPTQMDDFSRLEPTAHMLEWLSDDYKTSIRDEIVSAEGAREVYGVVIAGDGRSVDMEATRALRG